MYLEVDTLCTQPPHFMKSYLSSSKLTIWDVATRTAIGEPMQCKGEVLSVSWSGNDRYIATGDRSGKLTIWDVASKLTNWEEVVKKRGRYSIQLDHLYSQSCHLDPRRLHAQCLASLVADEVPPPVESRLNDADKGAQKTSFKYLESKVELVSAGVQTSGPTKVAEFVAQVSSTSSEK